MQRFVLSIVATYCCLASPPSIAQAGPDLDAIEQKLVKHAAEESRLKNEARAREKELTALRQQMIEAANSLQSAEQKIERISSEIEEHEAREAVLIADLEIEQGRLGDVLAAMMALERSKPPALLVLPNDVNKAARTAMLLADAAPTINAKATALRAAINELDLIRRKLTKERANFQKTNLEITSRREILTELLAKKQNERDVATRLAAAAQSETAALASRATSLKGILERLERFARSITPRLKPKAPNNRPAPGSTPQSVPKPTMKPGRTVIPFSPARMFSAAKGLLRTPVSGQIIGKFGKRRPEGGKFDGLRFLTRDNAIVISPFEADVSFARTWDPIGNLVVLDVGEGYHILFMGIGSFLVEEGQKISAGEPLGTMNGVESRLDLEIRKNGEPVNPSLWLSVETR